ncbi:MAG: hypothetical protein WC415_01940 [Patescibacteria group bacterium]|jgi:hypothetical protein
MNLSKSKIFIIIAFFLLVPATILASESDGTILSGHEYGWGDQSGWVNFGTTLGNVHVTDTGLTGYAWAANHGWINLNPSLGGVHNDSAGNLSGSAWGEQLGWISFANVGIDAQGNFNGTATGTLAGTITFDCAYCDTRTDWRPASARIVCGNGIIETDEQCDGGDFGGKTCASLGYSSGSLSCRADCSLNTSGCSSGDSGGGGGGGVAPATTVIFSGWAYPKSIITLLKDAQVAATGVAGTNDASFQITLTGLSGGNYTFSAYSEDSRGNRSSLLTFSVSVTAGVTTNVNGVFIAPTISVDKKEVAQGDDITIFGQSAPDNEITITVNSEEAHYAKTISDKNGIYLYNFDTAPLELGQHFTKSKAAVEDNISTFSKTIDFLVSTKTIISPPAPKCLLKADLNDDCKINLIDFSIAAYWYKRPLNADIKILETEKLNNDGKIDLVDFSIMAFYWTG